MPHEQEQGWKVEKARDDSHSGSQHHEHLLQDAYAPGSGAFKFLQRESTETKNILSGFSLDMTRSSPNISDSASPAQREKFLTDPENRHQPDIGSIWGKDSRFLAIGDQHLPMCMKEWTARNMGAFAQGVDKDHSTRAFAMEFLPKGAQGQLDEYAALLRKGPSDDLDIARRKLLDTIILQQRELDDKPNKRMEQPLVYQMDMLDAAIKAGMRPLSVEPDIKGMWAGPKSGFDLMHEGIKELPEGKGMQELFEQFTSSQAGSEKQAAARAELGKELGKNWGVEKANKWLSAMETARDAGMDFSKMKVHSENNGFYDEAQKMRNKSWAEVASAYLSSNPENRLVMFGGAAHFKYGENEGPLGKIPSVNELLDRGFKPTVLHFAGGDYARGDIYYEDQDNFNSEFKALQERTGGDLQEAPESAKFVTRRWTDSALNAGVSDRLFAVPVAQGGAHQADWVIHFPQSLTGRLKLPPY